MFLTTTKQNCQNLFTLLHGYCNASGQHVSLQKSVVYFGANVPPHLALELSNILNMPKVDDPGKYLGIPTIWGRLKCETVKYIKDRVMEKIAGWKKRFLSQACKEVLIKAMVQAIPMYPMCVFRLPITLCNEIDAALAMFWWARADKDRGIHWINWKELGRSKRKGGLGFCNLYDFNIALLAKQCW